MRNKADIIQKYSKKLSISDLIYSGGQKYFDTFEIVSNKLASKRYGRMVKIKKIMLLCLD